MQLNRGCLNLECLEGTILVKWVILWPLGGLFFFIWLYANNFEQNSEGKRKTANVNKLIKHSTTDVYCMWTVFILFGGIFCVCAAGCGIFFNLKLKKKLLCYIRSWSEYCGIFYEVRFLNDLSLWNTATTTTASVNFVYGLFWDLFRLVFFVLEKAYRRQIFMTFLGICAIISLTIWIISVLDVI